MVRWFQSSLSSSTIASLILCPFPHCPKLAATAPNITSSPDNMQSRERGECLLLTSLPSSFMNKRYIFQKPLCKFHLYGDLVTGYTIMSRGMVRQWSGKEGGKDKDHTMLHFTSFPHCTRGWLSAFGQLCCGANSGSRYTCLSAYLASSLTLRHWGK